MAKKTTTTTTPIKHEKKKSSDEVVISAPAEPITKSLNSDNKGTTPYNDAPSKEPTAPLQTPEVNIFNKEFCGTLWGMVFDKLAVTKGEHWKLTDAEKLTIGETTSAVANKYIGDLLGDYPELAALGISVAVIAVPRVLEDGKIKQANRRMADRPISKMGDTKDTSVPSIPTDQKHPSSGSKGKPNID